MAYLQSSGFLVSIVPPFCCPKVACLEFSVVNVLQETSYVTAKVEDLDDFFAVTFCGPGDHILDLIPEEGVTDLRTLGLNERQIEALRLMVNEDKELGNAEYQRLFNVSRNTASRDLRALAETGWVKVKGTGRGTRYRAA